MITDWIGRHDVLLPINQNYDKILEMNKASIEHWTILKSRYECWKTQQFTQQSAPQQRTQNGAYCPFTSMTCATVQLMLKSGFDSQILLQLWLFRKSRHKPNLEVLPNMVFPPIWGEKWRRSEHAHVSYPGLSLPPRVQPLYGAVRKETSGTGLEGAWSD